MPIRSIPVSEAKAGMITIRDITDNSGRILIHSGSRLSPVAIRRLPMWDIETIFVECNDLTDEKIDDMIIPKSSDASINSNIDTVLISQIAAKVRNRFKSVDQDEFYKTYMSVLLRYLVNNNNNGNGIIPGFY